MSIQNPTKKVQSYSLGIEELAMAMGLINRPDLGHEYIISTYPDLSEKEIDERLTSATHSLLARSLCTISESGSPLLADELESALFPLARFDYYLQVNIVREETPITATIHIQKGKTFTSHTVSMGVIHVLEHGSKEHLSDYLQDVFEDFGDNQEDIGGTSISLGILGQTLNSKNDQASAVQGLIQSGWTKEHAGKLVDDLSHQDFRSTILRVNINSETPDEELKNIPAMSLVMLKGKKRSWLIEFPTSDDDAEGKPQLVDKNIFSRVLNRFIN